MSHVSLLGAALSMSVTTIGAGVLAIPATFESDGVALVALALIAVGVFTVISIDFLILCVIKLGAKSYEEISDELLGRIFKEIIRWMLIAYNIGTAVGYIVVIGEIFTPMLPVIQMYVPWFSTSSHVMIASWALIMLPLSCFPKVSHLHATSFLAIAATFIMSSIIVYRYFVPLRPIPAERGVDEDIKYFRFSYRSLLALPVVMFSFDCQSLVFQVYTGLKVPTRYSMAKVATTSVLVTSLIYGLVGFFGYASHTPHVHGNILTNYNPLRDHLFAVGEILYSITVNVAYVLILIPCRDAIFQMAYGFSHTHESLDIPNHSNIIVSVLLSLACLCFALMAPGFLFIVALMGAFCSSTLCFTYPALFRQRLHVLGIAPYVGYERYAVLAMYGFGFVGFMLGFFVLFGL
ncbi:putative mitochondrial amino acid permease, putative (AAT27.2) [Leptomonas pyrrhocoris]|uniref:Putative mitochondrial amino acid permease, putative (AAT27.2) n=1 Tax=Leptomonas pyrrhocoris TaxID=157538 RepID=A0A0M9GB23_LEPPY|nr:putative mitochondrial amino acid permease, putative (AAT27.2) [Leptomonas pyrrhocoris]KPA86680.1 putative mitochondrial amino acid permease, putative (AAT27.2) [Leptomonas pyrrhocoris]|eukprot:XP_015665119.1 putative mitochondrial amino acid permease, putative (AAT27.2) [Leptomonas pyrrhocoris]